jgi:thiol:disulfide interchange protein DsbA
MKNWKNLLWVFVLLPLAAVANADEHWQEGKHYEKLSSPVPTRNEDKIEVAEVFWYGCPHCYAFKPLIEKWEVDMPDDVAFELLPAALGRAWEPHARAYYTTEALGVTDKTHDALFEALARDRKQLTTAEALADYLSDYGVDEDEFIKTFNSFGVNAKMQQSQSRIRAARITGVPTMLINGKYKISASTAGSHEIMIEVIDYLVKKERAAE